MVARFSLGEVVRRMKDSGGGGIPKSQAGFAGMTPAALVRMRQSGGGEISKLRIAGGYGELVERIEAGWEKREPSDAKAQVNTRRHGAVYVRLHSLLTSLDIPPALYLSVHGKLSFGSVNPPAHLLSASAINAFSDYIEREGAERYPNAEDLMAYLVALGEVAEASDPVRQFENGYLRGREYVERMARETGLPTDLVVTLELEALPTEYIAANITGVALVRVGAAPASVLSRVNAYMDRINSDAELRAAVCRWLEADRK